MEALHETTPDAPALTFTPAGPDDDRFARLHASLYVLGVLHHVEALRDSPPHDEEIEEDIRRLYELGGDSDGGAFATVEIGASRYVLYMVPSR